MPYFNVCRRELIFFVWIFWKKNKFIPNYSTDKAQTKNHSVSIIGERVDSCGVNSIFWWADARINFLADNRWTRELCRQISKFIVKGSASSVVNGTNFLTENIYYFWWDHNIIVYPTNANDVTNFGKGANDEGKKRWQPKKRWELKKEGITWRKRDKEKKNFSVCCTKQRLAL